MSVSSREEANRIYFEGRDAWDTLMGGARKWSRIPLVVMRRDQISDGLLLALAHGDASLHMDYIASLEEEAITAVREAAFALRCWSRDNGRADLVSTPVQRIEQMVKERP